MSRFCSFVSTLLVSFSIGLPLSVVAQGLERDWTTQVKPFQIADHLYYVGSRDLASYLVTTPEGNILINANLQSSPPQIRHSVEQLGFRWKDTKILLISHAHFDHAAGAAEIRKETGATFEVMEGDVDVMQSGGATDFAAHAAEKMPQFPPAHVDHVLHNGEQVTLGGVTLVAHRTPGHTRGCTSWSLRVHVPGEPETQLRDVVIVGSWSVLSSYRLLSVRGGQEASYPGIANDYAVTFSTLGALPCDLFLASHGKFFDLLGKMKRMPAEGDKVWIDPKGYREAIREGQADFQAAYRREAKAAEATPATR